MSKRTPRLHFTDAELSKPEVKEAARKAGRASDRLDKAEAKINGFLAKGVQIMLRDNSLFYKQFQTTLEMATRSPKEIAEQCFALFKANYRWQNKVRALCVRAISLVPEKCPQQLTIFDDPVRREKQDKMDAAIEDIRRRYGKRAVYNACLMGDIKVHEIGAQTVTMPGLMFA